MASEGWGAVACQCLSHWKVHSSKTQPPAKYIPNPTKPRMHVVGFTVTHAFTDPMMEVVGFTNGIGGLGGGGLSIPFALEGA